MPPRELTWDTDASGDFRVGRDEDALVHVHGRREALNLHLPYTTAHARSVTLVNDQDSSRTVQAHTANYGADCLRVLPMLTLAPHARTVFAFHDGYWHAREDPGGP